MTHRALFAIAGCLALAGCASAPVAPDSVEGKSYAVVQSENPGILIVGVDGNAPILRSFFGYRANVQALPPGEHVLWIASHGAGLFPSITHLIKLTAEAGHVYLIKDQPIDIETLHVLDLRVVDMKSGEIAGQVQSAGDEPEMQGVPPVLESPFFSWTPPQNDGWYLRQHGDFGALLLKTSENIDELSTISIRVTQLPTVKSDVEFREHVAKVTSLVGPDKDRFEVLVDTIASFDGRADYCVRLERLMIDKKTPAGDPLSSAMHAIGREIGTLKPLIVESSGYACRSTGNKNLMVAFVCSHRYYQGHEDGELPAKSEKLFARLKL